jgi:hypothetical protein
MSFKVPWEGFDGLSIKPKKYFGDAWAEIRPLAERPELSR